MTITFNSGLKHGQKRSANLLNVVNASTTAGKMLYGSVAAIYAHTPMCTAVIRNFFCTVDSRYNSYLQGKSKKGSSYREFEENSRDSGEKQFLLHSEHFNHI